MGLHETKRLLNSKGKSAQTEEIAYTMGENLWLLHILQGINNKNI
jgi:hypothetical protein